MNAEDSFLLAMMLFFLNLSVLGIVIYNGSIIWASCMFKNIFVDKTQKSRKLVKIAGILYLIVSASVTTTGAFIKYWTVNKIRDPDNELDTTTLSKVGRGLFWAGNGCTALGVFAVLIAGIIFKCKFNQCTPKIDDDAEKESLKGKGELVDFKPFGCCKNDCCSFQVYLHNLFATKCAVGHVWVLVVVSGLAFLLFVGGVVLGE